MPRKWTNKILITNIEYKIAEYLVLGNDQAANALRDLFAGQYNEGAVNRQYVDLMLTEGLAHEHDVTLNGELLFDIPCLHQYDNVYKILVGDALVDVKLTNINNTNNYHNFWSIKND